MVFCELRRRGDTFRHPLGGPHHPLLGAASRMIAKSYSRPEDSKKRVFSSLPIIPAMPGTVSLNRTIGESVNIRCELREAARHHLPFNLRAPSRFVSKERWIPWVTPTSASPVPLAGAGASHGNGAPAETRSHTRGHSTRIPPVKLCCTRSEAWSGGAPPRPRWPFSSSSADSSY